MELLGHVFLCNLIPADYAKVMVFEVNPDHLEDELDQTTEDGIKYLQGDPKNNFVLLNRGDIVFSIRCHNPRRHLCGLSH